MSGANGAFLFTGLGVGKYRMKFTPLPGFVFSPAERGGDYQQDSNVNIITSFGPCVLFSAGQVRRALDAGLYQ